MKKLETYIGKARVSFGHHDFDEVFAINLAVVVNVCFADQLVRFFPRKLETTKISSVVGRAGD